MLISVNGSDVPVSVNFCGALPVVSVNGFIERGGLIGTDVGDGMGVGRALNRKPVGVGVPDRVATDNNDEDVAISVPFAGPIGVMVVTVRGHVQD